MKKRIISKALAVAVIILFIWLGFQPAIAIKSNTSDSGDGPDLKCSTLAVTEGEAFSGLPFLIIRCKVINIGDDYSGKISYSGKGWRRNIFGKEVELFPESDSKNVNWKKGEIKNIDICFSGFPVMWMPFGIYHLKFNINANGDTNNNNDEFDRYFFYCLYRFYPTIINL